MTLTGISWGINSFLLSLAVKTLIIRVKMDTIVFIIRVSLVDAINLPEIYYIDSHVITYKKELCQVPHWEGLTGFWTGWTRGPAEKGREGLPDWGGRSQMACERLKTSYQL